MFIAGEYSFNDGSHFIEENYPSLLTELREIIANVDASKCKSKTSKEKTMPGRILFNPKALNKAFKFEFQNRSWSKQKVACTYSAEFYMPSYKPRPLNKGAFREMDFIKQKLGIEVQFGKYAFMVYNVCAKMTIFYKLGFIDAGIEIVPIKEFADEMSTGVSYFEQFVWDLQQRGISNIDIPVLVLGVNHSPKSHPILP